METMKAFGVEVDAARNRLRLSYSGHVTATDVSACLAHVTTLVEALKPGFLCLADLSRLELMDIECGPRIAKMMDLFRDHGVGKVVRIMPDESKDIGINILSIIHYRGKVPIATYASELEAASDLV